MARSTTRRASPACTSRSCSWRRSRAARPRPWCAPSSSGAPWPTRPTGGWRVPRGSARTTTTSTFSWARTRRGRSSRSSPRSSSGPAGRGEGRCAASSSARRCPAPRRSPPATVSSRSVSRRCCTPAPGWRCALRPSSPAPTSRSPWAPFLGTPCCRPGAWPLPTCCRSSSAWPTATPRPTIPSELREAAAVFRFDPWMRFTSLELPFAALGLVWNSMMSWAGGWFFLMAAEIFNVGARDFRLPGLGAYLQVAASRGDVRAVILGLCTLVLVIVLLDQVVWRPVLAWADKFKLEMTAGEDPPESWCHDVLSRAWIVEQVEKRIWEPLSDRLDRRLRERFPARPERTEARRARPSGLAVAAGVAAALLAGYGAYGAAGLLATLPGETWRRIGLGVLATFGRVAVALLVAMLWTIPVGVLIGTNRRLAGILQPVVQVIASVPAP